MVGDGVEMGPCLVLPLKGWDQINMRSTIMGLALSGPFSPERAAVPNVRSPP